MRAAILKIARDTYRAIGAEGFARIDFLVRGDEVFLSEINTIPGFTPISLFPTMPADGGYTFGDVCARVVDLALERHAARVGGRLPPGRPAAMTTVPTVDHRDDLAHDPPLPLGRRDAAAPAPRPPCLDAADADPGRRDPRDARSPRGRSTGWRRRPPSASTASRSAATSSPRRTRSATRSPSTPGTNLVGLDDRADRRAPPRDPLDRRRVRHRRAAGRPAGRRSRSASRSSSGPSGEHRFAVDDGGFVFADVGDEASPRASPPCRSSTDQRAAAAALGIRSVLDPVDLDAATRLGVDHPGPDRQPRPERCGSWSPTRTDSRSTAAPKGWSAVFGFYGRSSGRPALIPGQVQLLTALLAGREDTIQTRRPRRRPRRHLHPEANTKANRPPRP